MTMIRTKKPSLSQAVSAVASTVSVLMVVLSASLIGCATSGDSGTRQATRTVPENARSGFLRDYEKLEPVTGEEGATRWLSKAADWKKYTRFMVDAVVFHVPPAHQDEVRPRPEVVAAMTREFRAALIREIGAKYEIVDEPGAGVMRIRAALTSITPTSKQLQAWHYIPIALVSTGIGEATGVRGKNLLIFMEGDLSDSVNGALLGEVMQGRISQEADSRGVLEATPEDVKPVLDFWARRLREMVEKLQAASS